MAIDLSVVLNFFKGNTKIIATILIILVVLAIIFGGVFLITSIRRSKKGWTHTLIVRREMPGGIISSKEDKISMKRYIDPKTKTLTRLFQLQKPLLGSYLMPELAEYTGHNEYSIVLRPNNRIYLNKKTIFIPDKNETQISGKHGAIDVQFDELTKTIKITNMAEKKWDLAEIVKNALYFILIVGFVIIAIVALQEWGKIESVRAQTQISFTEAIKNMNTLMETVQATVTIQQIEISTMLRELNDNKSISSLK